MSTPSFRTPPVTPTPGQEALDARGRRRPLGGPGDVWRLRSVVAAGPPRARDPEWVVALESVGHLVVTTGTWRGHRSPDPLGDECTGATSSDDPIAHPDLPSFAPTGR